MKAPSVRLCLNIILTIIFVYSFYLFVELPQPYGRISAAVVLVGLLWNFISSRWIKFTFYFLSVAGSAFCLYAGTTFLLENIQKRKLFDLETAVHFEKDGFDEALRKRKRRENLYLLTFTRHGVAHVLVSAERC